MLSAIFRNRFSTRFFSTNCSINELYARGIFADVFPDTAKQEIAKLCDSEKQCIYAGFDSTADGLHVGSLSVLVNLLRWYRKGHDVIILLGDATALIGDPSGKSTERSKISNSQVLENTFGIENDIHNLINNFRKYIQENLSRPLSSDRNSIRILRNGGWYKQWPAFDFVSQIGRLFRMENMLSRSNIQNRLESPQGMGVPEFSYQIFQSYDWLYLLKKFNCRFQLGGLDQMCNIESGFHFISRNDSRSVYGLTLPLIKSKSGNKFGKTAGEVVWLRSTKTSFFDFYQFWFRTPDADVEHLLKLFTFESLDNIQSLMAQHWKSPEKHIAQQKLAECVTLLVHGQNGLEQALETSKILYGNDISNIAKLPVESVARVFSGAPVVRILLEAGLTVLDIAMRAKCFPTKTDAIRIISAGGFYMNYQKVTHCSEAINPIVHILPNQTSLIRVGKKNYYIVQWLT